jgi:hypothetical protein
METQLLWGTDHLLRTGLSTASDKIQPERAGNDRDMLTVDEVEFRSVENPIASIVRVRFSRWSFTMGLGDDTVYHRHV